ncbi:DUF2336 domain-containing protein [Micavibrio aeruginosavorus]|uniref:DUF2336 domain-containing protein n=1 Tax=Micavibrio aeruginosavorus TaxID=349221 RepID=UPI003F4A930A
MFAFIHKLLFKNGKSDALPGRAPRNDARYEIEKQKARSGSLDERLAIAKNPETHPEILYYLAQADPSDDVRHAVAENHATPLQASLLIAKDSSADVRLALAERLVRLLPNLTQEEQAALYAHAVQTLGLLALDEVLKIRKALSATLKDKAYAPPSVVSTLARDVERTVAEPILRFCAAVPDDVLIEILKMHPEDWASEAIAGRDHISGGVSVAVIEHGSAAAGKTLIENKGADIGPTLLQRIIDRARDLPEWQRSLADHRSLPPEMAEKLAEFANESVRLILVRSGKFDRRTTEEVATAFKRRLGYAANQSDKAIDAVTDGDSPQNVGPPDGKPVKSEEEQYAYAARMAREGRLDEEMLSDALAMQDYDFIYAAISIMGRVTLADVRRVFALRAPKPIVALSWKAGLSMRMALRLQQDLGRVPPRQLLYPKGGTDYPMDEDELRWQLEFLGLEAA